MLHFTRQSPFPYPSERTLNFFYGFAATGTQRFEVFAEGPVSRQSPRLQLGCGCAGSVSFMFGAEIVELPHRREKGCSARGKGWRCAGTSNSTYGTDKDANENAILSYRN